MDVLTQSQRSKNMAAIRSKNTRPEMVIRKLVFRMGYRYRLHSKTVTGKPDLVFPSLRKAIFVHGCFWHMHDCRYGRVIPKTNADFWEKKRLGTAVRDKNTFNILHGEGWKTCTVWECELKNLGEVEAKIRRFLET